MHKSDAFQKLILVMEAGRADSGDLGAPLLDCSQAQVQRVDPDREEQNPMPQLFTSMPALNEAASYLAQTTSLITGCFTGYTVDHAPEYSAINGQELLTYSGEQTGSPADDCPSPSGRESLTPEATNSMYDGISVSASQNSTALINFSRPYQNIFQGLIERARKTVRGSADDIGWLQHAPGMPPVEDGTQRFDDILDSIRHGVHRLPKTLVYLLVPGTCSNINSGKKKNLILRLFILLLDSNIITVFVRKLTSLYLKCQYLIGLFSNHGPLYFVNTKMSFSKMGLACHIAKIHSEASVEKNAREIKEYIEEIYWGSNKQVLILGHSKGGIDAAAALSMYWPDLKDKVAGLALAQSPYGGSPIASDILRDGQLGDYVNLRKMLEILICKVIKGDMQSLEDLTYEKRREFLSKHHFPKELPVVSFHTEAGITPAVLSTLSHVAHAELPISAGESKKLPVVVPLGAAMAACAQLLQVRYGEKSDGLVTRRDAEVPGSVVVRPKRKLDHAWMVYSSLSDDPHEADASQVCEALLQLLIEIGQKKR
uniref:Alpha/beta-Hydrolases superfamily protein n=1 Tax=Kalanchoe fedtschenkoi TaxID=63787 RepID=A0A7N0UPD5_KALFE